MAIPSFSRQPPDSTHSWRLRSPSSRSAAHPSEYHESRGTRVLRTIDLLRQTEGRQGSAGRVAIPRRLLGLPLRTSEIRQGELCLCVFESGVLSDQELPRLDE